MTSGPRSDETTRVKRSAPDRWHGGRARDATAGAARPPRPFLLRRDGHDGEHSLLEVSGNVAHEEVLARREVDRPCLRATWIDVVAVADQRDPGSVFHDVARGVRR